MLSIHPQDLVQKSWNSHSYALIIETQREGDIFTSSAVAIGSDLLLTAAHSVSQIDQCKVILGNYIQNAPYINVESIYIHEGYDPNKSFYQDDIAIIKLKSKLPQRVFPLSIGRINEKETFTRLGFGGRNGCNSLAEFEIELATQSLDDKNLIFFDEESVIGDSGGPIIQNQKLVGIHSTKDQGGFIYTINLNHYQDWINTQILNLDLDLVI